jgi:hypothetical protein
VKDGDAVTREQRSQTNRLAVRDPTSGILNGDGFASEIQILDVSCLALARALYCAQCYVKKRLAET